MTRWEPGGTERLRTAALELYVRQGFEQTTVAEIAAAAGLTERTFFRHFADKREVLFTGQELLLRSFLQGLLAAPDAASPLAAVAAGLASSSQFFDDERRASSRQRQTVIDRNPALQERESLKLTTMATALAEGLRSRGVPDPTATIAAQSGVTVFSVSFSLWIGQDERRSFDEIERSVFAELSSVAAAV